MYKIPTKVLCFLVDAKLMFVLSYIRHVSVDVHSRVNRLGCLGCQISWRIGFKWAEQCNQQLVEQASWVQSNSKELWQEKLDKNTSLHFSTFASIFSHCCTHNTIQLPLKMPIFELFLYFVVSWTAYSVSLGWMPNLIMWPELEFSLISFVPHQNIKST